MQWIENIKPEMVLQLISIVVGAFFSYKNFANSLPTSRAQLKADLDILKLLDPQDPNYGLVHDQVTASVRRIYRRHIPRDVASPSRMPNWTMLIFYAVVTLLLTIWTVYLLRDGFSWWALATGFFAFGFFGNVLTELEKKRPPTNRGNSDANRLNTTRSEPSQPDGSSQESFQTRTSPWPPAPSP